MIFKILCCRKLNLGLNVIEVILFSISAEHLGRFSLTNAKQDNSHNGVSFFVNPVRNNRSKIFHPYHLKPTNPNRWNQFHFLQSLPQILCCQFQDADIDWMEKYGNRLGFCCYVLRYVAVLNRRHNLGIQNDEFRCMVAMVLSVLESKADEAWYRDQCLCPSPKCLTLISWLQVSA